MAISRTNLLKRNFDFRRKQVYPNTATIELQTQNDDTRNFATYRTLLSGWILEEETIFDPDARRVLVLKVAENAVTDAASATIDADEMLSPALNAVVLGTMRYECRPGTPPLSDPKHYRIEVHWIGDVEAEAAPPPVDGNYDKDGYDEQQYGN